MVESLYSKLYHPTTIAKQRVVERFDGDALDERWTTLDRVLSSTYQMSDGVGQGFEIITSSTSGVRSTIGFNNINQFSFNGEHIIGIIQRITTSNAFYDFGLHPNQSTNDNLNSALIQNWTGATFYVLITGDGSATTNSNLSKGQDAVKRKLEIQLDGTNTFAWLDGILEATKSSNYPTANHEPLFQVGNTGATAVTGRIMYCEVYNT